jgi:hypothetical protein
MKNKKHKIDIISKRLQGLINAWEIVSSSFVLWRWRKKFSKTVEVCDVDARWDTISSQKSKVKTLLLDKRTKRLAFAICCILHSNYESFFPRPTSHENNRVSSQTLERFK